MACIGLMVNLLSAWALKEHPHDHDAELDPDDKPHGHDHNMRAAYLHVLADALTSILAISALVIGRFKELSHITVEIN